MRVFLLFWLVAVALAAEPFSLEALAEANKSIQSLRATFVQEKHLAIFDEPVVSPGVIEIDRARSAVRWEFTGKSVLLFAEGKVRRFGAEGKEETIAASDQGVQNIVAQMKAFLHGDFSAMKELFSITPASDNSPQLHFVPKAKDLAKYITSLDIRWRANLSAPEYMLLVAAGDDRTEYRFAEPQIDLSIPAERFTKP
jgi:Outer membrane lipoprotein carrier protein LolA